LSWFSLVQQAAGYEKKVNSPGSLDLQSGKNLLFATGCMVPDFPINALSAEEHTGLFPPIAPIPSTDPHQPLI
jgi:hypothetical protein